MKSIAFFSVKGGVGKTTLACNLAGFLAKTHGLRVLLVDADPQSSATEYLLSDEGLDKYYSDSAHFGLYQYYDAVEESKLFPARVPDILHSPRFDIDLIPGHPNLGLQEDKLSRAWSESLSGREHGLQATLAFKYLLNQVEEQYDFVFIDMGPLLGALNRSILLAADFFLIPVSPDRFSLLGMENVILSLNGWREGINSALDVYRQMNTEPFKLNRMPVKCKLSLLGFVQQRYNTLMFKGERHPTHSHALLQKNLAHGLGRLAREFGFRDFEEALLGSIPNLGSLIAISMLSHAPVFELGTKDGVVGAQFARVDDTKVLFGEITERLLQRVVAARLEGQA